MKKRLYLLACCILMLAVAVIGCGQKEKQVTSVTFTTESDDKVYEVPELDLGKWENAFTTLKFTEDKVELKEDDVRSKWVVTITYDDDSSNVCTIINGKYYMQGTYSETSDNELREIEENSLKYVRKIVSKFVIYCE